MELGYFYGYESAEQFQFFRIPKLLMTHFKELSDGAKILYGLMLDRLSLSRKSRWIDDCGRLYIRYAVSSIMEDMSCQNQKAAKLVAELESAGLIKTLRQGQGKTTVIYVLNFADIKQSETIVSHVKKCENHISKSDDTIKHEVLNSQAGKMGDSDSETQTSDADSGSTDIKQSETIVSHVKKCENHISKSDDTAKHEVLNSQTGKMGDSDSETQISDADSGSADTKKCENHISRDVKITLQEVWKSHANHTNNNQTDNNETDPIYPSVGVIDLHKGLTDDTIDNATAENRDSDSQISDADSGSAVIKTDSDSARIIPAAPPKVVCELRPEIKDRLEWDNVRSAPQKYGVSDFSKYDTLCQIIDSEIRRPKRTYHIQDEDVSGVELQSVFRGLSREHLVHVLKNVERVRPMIRNEKRYFIAALYRAPETIKQPLIERKPKAETRGQFYQFQSGQYDFAAIEAALREN